MNGWQSFFAAQVGASAALSGLVFLAISINLNDILKFAQLPGRAAHAIILLVTVLIESSVMLIPRQSSLLLGVELLLVGVTAWIISARVEVGVFRKSPAPYRNQYIQHVMFSRLAMSLLVFAGIAVIFWGYGGIYWLLPGLGLCYTEALLATWVLLIEIKR